MYNNPMKKIILFFLFIITFPENSTPCTLWSASGKDFVKDGGTLIAKNRDWVPDHSQYLKNVTPKHGFRYFGLFAKGNDDPGLKAGINEKGLVVVSSSAGSVPKIDRNENNKTVGLMTKLLSDCESVDSVLKKEKLFIGAKNLMVADKNQVAIIEIGLNGEYSIRTEKNGTLTHTNHFIDDKMLKYNKKIGKSSSIRFNRINEILCNASKPFTLEDFIAFSEDQTGGPDNSIWRTGSSPKEEKTLSTWLVYLSGNDKIQVFVKIANPGEEKKIFTFKFEDLFK
jgi:isopenicillin-N N-acyltransferase like protein